MTLVKQPWRLLAGDARGSQAMRYLKAAQRGLQGPQALERYYFLFFFASEAGKRRENGFLEC